MSTSATIAWVMAAGALVLAAIPVGIACLFAYRGRRKR